MAEALSKHTVRAHHQGMCSGNLMALDGPRFSGCKHDDHWAAAEFTCSKPQAQWIHHAHAQQRHAVHPPAR